MSILQASFKSYDDDVKKVIPTYSGILGLQLDGAQQVEHLTRNGFVYVRLRDNLSEVVLAFNDKVSPVFNLPVVVERRGNQWFIAGRDVDRYSNWGSSAPFLPKHGFQHSFNRDENTGGDVVPIYPDQFMPLLVYPNSTTGSNLLIAPYLLQRDSDFIYVGNTGTQNLLPFKPTGSSAVMGLVYLNTDTGNPGVLIGNPFSASATGTAGIAPYIPYPASNQEPLYAFRLTSGTESLQWENLYNARQFIGGGVGGGGGGGGEVDGGDAFAGLPLKIRRDTEANWISENPVAEQGELIWVTDDPQTLRIGNGTDNYLGLAPFNPPKSLDALTDVTVSSEQEGEFIRHDGGGWVNAFPSAADGSFTTVDFKTVVVEKGIVVSIT